MRPNARKNRILSAPPPSLPKTETESDFQNNLLSNKKGGKEEKKKERKKIQPMKKEVIYKNKKESIFIKNIFFSFSRLPRKKEIPQKYATSCCAGFVSLKKKKRLRGRNIKYVLLLPQKRCLAKISTHVYVSIFFLPLKR